MKKLRFSIITVSFNSEKTIEDTIKSVLNQSYNDYEYIIIDGKSTDRTVDIIKKYEPLFAGKMQWISEEDKGIYDAMNKGIARADGDVVGIINSDDWLENDALEIVANEVNKNSYRSAIYYGMCRFIKDNQENTILFCNINFIRERMIMHPSAFVSKAIYDKIGCFSLDYKLVSDYDFMLRAREANVVFVPVYKILSNFREGGASSANFVNYEVLDLYKQHGIITDREYKRRRLKNKIFDIKRSILG